MADEERKKKLKEITFFNQRKKIPILKTEVQIQKFVEKSLKVRNGEKHTVNLGRFTDEAKERIKKVYAHPVNFIDLDNEGVVHSFRKEGHNLMIDDMQHALDVMNNALDIKLSDRRHQDCEVLEFIKDIKGKLKILAEMRPKKDSATIFDAMRPKRDRKRPNAVHTNPKGLTPEANFHPAPDTNILPQNTQNVKKKKR